MPSERDTASEKLERVEALLQDIHKDATRPWRISLRDAVYAILLLALLCAWWIDRTRMHHQEARIRQLREQLTNHKRLIEEAVEGVVVEASTDVIAEAIGDWIDQHAVPLDADEVERLKKFVKERQAE